MSRAATRRRYVFHRQGQSSVSVLAHSWHDAHRRLKNGAGMTAIAPAREQSRLEEIAAQTGLRPVGVMKATA